MSHVMAPNHIRAVGKAPWMLLVGGAQQQRRRVDRAARNDHKIRGVFFAAVVAPYYDFAYLTPRRARFKLLDKGIRHQRDVRKLECRVDGTDLRVRLGPDQAGIAVASLAADAATGVRILLIEHDPQRRVKRMEPQARKVVGQLLDARLVADGRMR